MNSMAARSWAPPTEVSPATRSASSRAPASRTRTNAGQNPYQTDVYDTASGLPVLLDDGTRTCVKGAGGLAKAVDGNSQLEVFHTDGLGTVRAMADANGTVVQTYSTEAFGVVTPALTRGRSNRPLQYTGQRRDHETGSVYLRARVYVPSLGRFLQADPLRKSGPGVGGWNRYSYAGNNPVTAVDPSGLLTYFVGGIGGSGLESQDAYDDFIDALKLAEIPRVFQASAYDPAIEAYGETVGKGVNASEVYARSTTVFPYLRDPDARALKSRVLQEYTGDEPLNLIGYSGGATTVFNAALLLGARGISVANVITIGGVTLRWRPGNIGTWTRIIGDADWLAAAPGFPESTIHLPDVRHTDYFESTLSTTVSYVVEALKR